MEKTRFGTDTHQHYAEVFVFAFQSKERSKMPETGWRNISEILQSWGR